MTRDQIAAAAACYTCMDDNLKKAAIVYLLDQLASGNGVGYVLKSGDTMTGQLVLPSGKFPTQAVAPDAPANGFTLYSNAGGDFAFVEPDGFVRSITSTLTANRTYTLPNSSLTFAGTDVAQTFTALQTFANNIDVANGTTAQQIVVYNTISGGGANYERATITWNAVANELVIGTQKGGTGVGRTLSFMTDNSRRWQIPTTGNLICAIDNAYDIGASGSSRPKNLYLSGSITVGSTTLMTTSVALTNGAGAAAGTLNNAPAAGNPTKWIAINDNGTTRQIPAW